GAYLEATYRKFTAGKGYAETSGLYTEDLDFSGNDIERTPKFAGNIGFIQTLNLGENGELELGIDANYNGSFFFSAQNTPKMVQDAYTLINARIGYVYTPWNLRTTVFGRNITDTDYYIGLYQNDFGVLANR